MKVSLKCFFVFFLSIQCHGLYASDSSFSSSDWEKVPLSGESDSEWEKVTPPAESENETDFDCAASEEWSDSESDSSTAEDHYSASFRGGCCESCSESSMDESDKRAPSEGEEEFMHNILGSSVLEYTRFFKNSSLSPDGNDWHGFPYFAATIFEYPERLDLLIFFVSQKVDFNVKCGSRVNIGHSLITYFRVYSQEDLRKFQNIFHVLLQNGLRRGTKNVKGETYLQHAVRGKRRGIVKFFLEEGLHKIEHDDDLQEMQEDTFTWAKDLSMQFALERKARRDRRQQKRLRNLKLKRDRILRRIHTLQKEILSLHGETDELPPSRAEERVEDLQNLSETEML